MTRTITVCITIFLVLMMLGTTACSGKTYTEAESKQIAEDFVQNEATFVFDGMEETLELTDTAKVENGWQFTYKFDSAQAGYGDRTGQMLAQVITPHTAVITVISGKVTAAVMDGYWDMKTQKALVEVEISLAPIEEVTVSILKSNPAQVSVHIKGGLPSGCTTFHNIEVTREGNTVNIKVSVQQPKDMFCPAIYTIFEKDVNLGTDFTVATTYTLNVNDYTTTFSY
jgi:hypothetical protein